MDDHRPVALLYHIWENREGRRETGVALANENVYL